MLQPDKSLANIFEKAVDLASKNKHEFIIIKNCFYLFLVDFLHESKVSCIFWLFGGCVIGRI